MNRIHLLITASASKPVRRPLFVAEGLAFCLEGFDNSKLNGLGQPQCRPFTVITSLITA